MTKHQTAANELRTDSWAIGSDEQVIIVEARALGHSGYFSSNGNGRLVRCL
jgi:hypothetical protein